MLLTACQEQIMFILWPITCKNFTNRMCNKPFQHNKICNKSFKFSSVIFFWLQYVQVLNSLKCYLGIMNKAFINLDIMLSRHSEMKAYCCLGIHELSIHKLDIRTQGIMLLSLPSQKRRLKGDQTHMSFTSLWKL